MRYFNSLLMLGNVRLSHRMTGDDRDVTAAGIIALSSRGC